MRWPAAPGARAVAVGAVVAALLLRLPGEGFPPGLYRDEAWYGLDALRTLSEGPSLWYPANNGREPLFIWLVAPFVALLGPTPAAVRLPAALAGAIATAAIYPMGAALAGRRAGAYAAWLMAVLPWAVIIGRMGLRASLLPAVLLMAVGILLRMSRRPGIGWTTAGWTAAAGALAGLTLYTYTAARALPLLALCAAMLLWAEMRSVARDAGGRVSAAGSGRSGDLGRRRVGELEPRRPVDLGRRRLGDLGRRRRDDLGRPRLGPMVALWLISAALTSAPLVFALFATPGGLFGRVSQVSIARSVPAIEAGDEEGAPPGGPGRLRALRPVLESAASSAGLFIVRGDPIPRHNIVERSRADLQGIDDAIADGSIAVRPSVDSPNADPVVAEVSIAGRSGAGRSGDGRPVFGPPAALLWLLGLVWAVRAAFGRPGRRRLHARTLLAALIVALLPTVLAVDAPHFLRAVGALPVGILVAAAGAGVLWRAVDAGRGGRPAAVATSALLAFTILFEAVASGRVLFDTASRDTPTYFAFESAATDLARDVNAALGAGWRGGWAVQGERDVRAGDRTTADHPLGDRASSDDQVDDRTSADTPLGDRAANDHPLDDRTAADRPAVWLDRRLRDGWAAVPFLVPIERLTLSDPYDPVLSRPGVAYLAPEGLDLDPLWSMLAPDTRLILSAGSAEQGDHAARARTMWVRVEAVPVVAGDLDGHPSISGVRLLEAEAHVIDDGSTRFGRADGADAIVSVLTRWRADKEVPEGLTLYVHVRDSGNQIAGIDAPIGFDVYPVERWERGQDVTEVRTLRVPGGLDPAHDRIFIGLYSWPSTDRLPIVDADGTVMDPEIVVWPATVAR